MCSVMPSVYVYAEGVIEMFGHIFGPEFHITKKEKMLMRSYKHKFKIFGVVI
jgi:hypothetical protein